MTEVKLTELMKRSKLILLALVWSLVLVDFWLFSRFTVDDAFITWRYGQNLVQHGVWNFNPTTFDPTQSYTNPIYALISIIPAALGINVVLFFKLLSLALFGWFTFWFLKRRPDSSIYLGLFYAVPATAIHLFSGLETFLFVSLVCQLFIYVKEHSYRSAIIVASFLFMTRPESWTLVLTLPLVLAWSRNRFHVKRFWKSLVVLGSVLGAYFLLHLWLFGELLPNTFFVKSTVATFEAYRFFPLLLVFAVFIPILLLRFRKVVLLAGLLFIPMIVNYGISDLTMDYASRYAYHLYASAALFVIYVYGAEKHRKKLAERFSRFRFGKLIPTLGVTAISVGFAYTTFFFGIYQYETYYPRLLNAHAELGKLLEGKVQAVAVGDAGLIPFVSGAKSLDIKGLGTHLGATNGVSDKLAEQYGVDFAVFVDGDNAGRNLKPWLRARSIHPICSMTFRPDYQMELWATQSTDALHNLCEQTKHTNGDSEFDFFIRDAGNAPWVYWR